MAIQLRRGDYNDLDTSQLLDGELAAVLENDPNTEDGTALYVSFGDDNVRRVLTSDEQVQNATTTTAGKVKPDGTTITVDDDGTIHGANTYTHPTYTARTGKPTSNQTPSFGGTFTVSQVKSDATGHVTEMYDRTVKIPNSTATQSAVGLMSSSDKVKLDGIVIGFTAAEIDWVFGEGEATIESDYLVPSGATIEDGYLMLTDATVNNGYLEL